MSTPPRQNQATSSVKMLIRRAPLLVLWVSLAVLVASLAACGASEPTTRTAPGSAGSDTGVVDPFEQVDLRASPSTPGVAPSGDPRVPVPCPAGRPRAWTLEEPTTVADRISVADYLTPTDMIVSRDGTATVAYQSAADQARSADDPPAGGDALDASGGRNGTWLWLGDNLGWDMDEAQTIVVQDPVRVTANPSNSRYNLVVADRPAGGSWSTGEAIVKHEPLDGGVDLAINAFGAAVLVWNPGDRLRAAYRSTAGAAWSSPQRLPASDAFDFDVDIDDLGRVVLAYDRFDDDQSGVYAIRRTRSGTWGPHQQLGGPGTELFAMALNSDGAALVSQGPTVDGTPLGRAFTSRMTADGVWQAAVQQPHSLGLHGVSVDDRGRTLIGGWDRGSLWGRWSRGDGSWRQPFPIAAGVRDTGRWGLDPRVTANGRGDALAAWGTKTGTGDLRVWARFATAGRDWTEPRHVAPTSQQPTRFDAAIGECGHAAFAWTPAGKPRRLHIRRATPSGPGQVTGR